jgi:hypothetical protein
MNAKRNSIFLKNLGVMLKNLILIHFGLPTIKMLSIHVADENSNPCKKQNAKVLENFKIMLL